MATTAPAPAPNIGPDGETIVDMSYYEILNISGSATPLEIKKAYRKAAVLNHPDRNPDPRAKEVFQEISEAYAVLSDSNLRAVYNKQGKKSAQGPMGSDGEMGQMPDPGEMFSMMFGGKAFEDWIGEISLGKDVSKAFEDVSEEDPEGLAAAIAASKADLGGTTTPPQGTIHHSSVDLPTSSTTIPSAPAGSVPLPFPSPTKASPTVSTSLGSATSPPPHLTSPAPPVPPTIHTARGPPKETPEQREKMRLYDEERINEKRERIKTLASKLRDRIRPFVEASNPGEADDPETKRFGERMRMEANDLAMESFGVEICQLIGEIYLTKASTYIKLHRKASSNVLGIPGWWNRMKERGQMVKEGWSFLSVGLDVQASMKDLERRTVNGEVDEEEMKAIEADLSGKLLLVAWKGSKFELSAVLRSVVDAGELSSPSSPRVIQLIPGPLLSQVLSKESPSVTDAILMNRAKAILYTGAILKAVKSDESDSERRELERMVAEAARKRKEKSGKAKKPTTPPVVPTA